MGLFVGELFDLLFGLDLALLGAALVLFDLAWEFSALQFQSLIISLRHGRFLVGSLEHIGQPVVLRFQKQVCSLQVEGPVALALLGLRWSRRAF